MPRAFKFYDRTTRPKLEYPPSVGEYIDYEVTQKVKKTGDGEEDYEVYDDIKEIKTNIKKFVNSYAKDVGVENILKRIAQTGDVSLLNQKEAIFMDTTIIPDDPGEAFQKAEAVKAAYEKIDKDLTSGKTIDEFVKGLNEQTLDDYINKKVEAIIAKKGAQDENSK